MRNPCPLEKTTSVGPFDLVRRNRPCSLHCMTSVLLQDWTVQSKPAVLFLWRLPQTVSPSKQVAPCQMDPLRQHSGTRLWTLGVQCVMYYFLWKLSQADSQSEQALIASPHRDSPVQLEKLSPLLMSVPISHRPWLFHLPASIAGGLGATDRGTGTVKCGRKSGCPTFSVYFLASDV